jgi:hypothetical protein
MGMDESDFSLDLRWRSVRGKEGVDERGHAPKVASRRQMAQFSANVATEAPRPPLTTPIAMAPRCRLHALPDLDRPNWQEAT